MSASKKTITFTSQPMGNKNVAELPGVGKTIGINLAAKGFSKAKHVYGLFLQLDEDKKKFCAWIAENGKANEGQAKQCFECLKEWSRQHFH